MRVLDRDRDCVLDRVALLVVVGVAVGEGVRDSELLGEPLGVPA